MTQTRRLLVSVHRSPEPVGLGGTEYPSSRPCRTGEDAVERLYTDTLVFVVLTVWRVECLIGTVRAAKLESEPSTVRELLSGPSINWKVFRTTPILGAFRCLVVQFAQPGKTVLPQGIQFSLAL